MINPRDIIIPWMPIHGGHGNPAQGMTQDKVIRTLWQWVGGKTDIRAQLTRKRAEQAGLLRPWDWTMGRNLYLTEKGIALYRDEELGRKYLRDLIP